MSLPGGSIANPQQVAILTQKLYDADSDIRYMSLNDLLAVAESSSSSSFLSNDYNQCNKLVDGFLNTLNDPNGEVQNLTIKCLGPFVRKAHPEILSGLLTKVSNQRFDNTVDSSISAMALRTIVVSLPRPTPGTSRSKSVNDSYYSINNVLIPRLIARGPGGKSSVPGLLMEDIKNGTDSQAIDVLTDVAKCFGSMLPSNELGQLQDATMELLESPRSGAVMKKKAMTAFAALAPYFSESLLSKIITHIINAMKTPHVPAGARKNYISLLGSLARAIPTKFGPHLKIITPFVLAPLAQSELDEQMGDYEGEERDSQQDEVREIALATLESFLVSCPNEMQKFTAETLESILRFLKYDANLAIGGEDMDDDFGDDFGDDDDFEQEDIANDEDDVSWKVRRSAAKTLQAIISAKGRDLLESSESFNKIAGALLDRFKEREESVRLEVVATTTYVVQQCGQDDLDHDVDVPASESESRTNASLGKKRRRGLSDATTTDHALKRRWTGSDSPSSGSPSPPGAPSNLASVGSSLMQAGLSLASTSTTSTKLASVALLKSFVIARHGGADGSLKEIFELTAEHVQSSQGSAIQMHTGSGPGSLQVESLQLLSEVCKATSSVALQPHISKAIQAVIAATHNRSTQVACEALRTAEQLVKVMTPPRSASQNKESPKLVGALLDVMMEIAGAKSSDLDPRKQAIKAIGTTLGRTLDGQGQGLVTASQRQKSFALLQDSLKNETTRGAAVNAIEGMGNQAQVGVTFDKAWFTSICIELGNQLRKADRTLRSSSLTALRTLLAERKGSKNLSNSSELVGLLMPMLASDDLLLIGPTLIIFASLISDSPDAIVNSTFIKTFSELMCSATAANVVDQISILVDAAGKRGAGKELMGAMLRDVGVKGLPAVVGKAIGDLLVSAGEATAGVRLADFLNELETSQDDKRKCLALSVIGEVGLRSGSNAGLKPELFAGYFDGSSHDVSIAAAIALGRAGAGSGNMERYVSVILRAHNRYLSLHALREVMLYCESQTDLQAFAKPAWDAATAAARTEDSRAIGAECLSQLSLLNPRASLQTLQAMLGDRDANVRSTSIITFRDIFSASDARFNKYLRPLIVDVLTTMMRDATPDNRKTALNTMSTAARHKPDLVLPALPVLISPIIDQTFEDASLIREVSMGPFKHKVDDGLEARKSAYETMYTLLEQSPTQTLPLVATLFPRIVAGVTDDTSIRTLSLHMLVRLAGLVPADTARMLDELAERFRSLLGRTLKENSVRVEQERLDEAKRSVVKATLEVGHELMEAGAGARGVTVKLGEGGVGIKWLAYIEELRKDYAVLLREVESQGRERV